MLYTVRCTLCWSQIAIPPKSSFFTLLRHRFTLALPVLADSIIYYIYWHKKMLKQSAIADAVPLVQKQVQQTLFFAIAIPITECRLSYIVLFKFVIAFLLVLSCLVLSVVWSLLLLLLFCVCCKRSFVMLLDCSFLCLKIIFQHCCLWTLFHQLVTFATASTLASWLLPSWRQHCVCPQCSNY